MGGQITLNDSQTAPISYNSPTQRYLSGIMPVTLDSSQTDEHVSNELRKQEIKGLLQVQWAQLLEINSQYL